MGAGKGATLRSAVNLPGVGPARLAISEVPPHFWETGKQA
jgi:hypothetical protein